MRKYVAEFIGTFVLTFVSCGAAAVLFPAESTEYLASSALRRLLGYLL